MAAVLPSCSKSTLETAGKKVDASLKLDVTVSSPCAETKAVIKTGWESSDKIKIWYDANTGTNPDLVIRYDGSKWVIDENATVSGNAPSTGSNHYLKAVYEDKVAVAAKDAYTYAEGTITFNLQTWTFLTEIQVAVSDYYPSLDGFSERMLHLSCSGFRPYEGYTVREEGITVKAGAKGAPVICCRYYGDFYFVYATADYSSEATEHVFTFKNEYNLTLLEYAVSKAIVKPASGIRAIKISHNYFKDLPAPGKSLKGLFSVRNGETAPVRHIHFSEGNLRAKWTGSKYEWFFADDQKSIVGKNQGNTSIDSQVNDKSVDLFCWSTTATNSNWGIHTKSDTDHIGGEFKDWGSLIDGGNTWRTLTADEWEYLLGRKNDKDEPLCQVTYINYTDGDVSDSGDYGLILYPDNYSGNITGNYTAAQWKAMQSDGCVFLPATGIREGSGVYYPTRGYYWSSKADESSKPFHMAFYNGYALVSSTSYEPVVSRSSGCAVRLVADVN